MDAFASLVDRDPHSNSTAGPHSLNSKHHDKHNTSSLLVAWIALQLAGQATLPFLVLTMLFHKKISRRNPTVINLCIVWTLATIPPLLLFYAGKHSGHKEPGIMLCLVQAATVSAALPMAAVAYLSVVLHACTVVNSIINANAVRPVSLDPRIILLMSSPYITFLLFSLSVAIIGAQNPKDVHPGHFFCEVENHHLSAVIFLFSVIVVFLTLVAQVWISIMFYRNWSAKRTGSIAHRGVSNVDLGLLLRMIFFTIFEIVILVSCVVTMANPHAGASKVLVATPPFAVFLIFASSPDILRAWFPCCFRKKPKRTLHDIRVIPQSQPTFEKSFDEDTRRTSDAESALEEPVVVEVHARTYDLEMGAPPVVPPTTPLLQCDEETHPTTTTMVVLPMTANAAPDSPMHAIRALRTPTGRI